MSHLTSFTVHCLTTPPRDLIESLLSTPTLRDIRFEDTPLNFDAIAKTNTGLTSIAVHNGQQVHVSGDARNSRPSWKRVIGQRLYQQNAAQRLPHDVATTTKLLVDHRLSLRNIEVPKELLSYDRLSFADWPALRRLTLTGHKPQEPLAYLLRGMPNITDLNLLYSKPSRQYSRDNDSADLPSMTIDEEVPLRDRLRLLRSLTISNPTKEDPIFTEVPPSLESLSVTSICDWPDETTGLTIEEAIWIVRAVSSSGVDLRELRMSLSEEPSAELVRVIAKEAPSLEFLQLGMDDYEPLLDDRTDQETILVSHESPFFISLSKLTRDKTSSYLTVEHLHRSTPLDFATYPLPRCPPDKSQP